MSQSASSESGCFSVHIERSANSARLTLTGEFDLGSAQAAGDALARLERESAGLLVVDMAAVTFLDLSLIHI